MDIENESIMVYSRFLLCIFTKLSLFMNCRQWIMVSLKFQTRTK
jgi:hypothetical protein